MYNLAFTRAAVPVNITGASIWFTVKYRYTDADPGLVQLTIGSGIVVTNAAGGLATVSIPNTTTALLPAPLALVYDVKVLESSGVYSTPIFGTLTVNPAVTNAT